MKREREEKSVAQKLIEKEGIEALFRSQMHSMIQDIEEAALLSEHVNLLAAEVEPEAADQEMQDFEAVKGDFEMIIISDEKEKKEEKNKKWIVKNDKKNEKEKKDDK
ncbi:uncharacterized protein BDCG_16711 [Blastomyces dermatitidis ER-3]|uniref:Uncharacterized protein n=1 Tax=Ajellomyces dermatitidis (strain ER-3 / ATCC MYA-2586) TaxID=559297 RepID=A0ABP2EVW8_AJEDR|nr:uncharacterized protein BDCG_16711 [Blastomyces dermatitidis ER-3]EEQ88148.2 hypothetical protein BDCG_16711 [Blastomyces dermatitidis ER-3]